MNKMTKKLLSGFMAFAMVLTMLPVSVFADGEDTVTPPTETPVEQPADSPVNGDAEGESEDKPADDTKDEPSSDNTSTGGDNTSDDGNNTSNDGNNAEENAALTKIAELQAQADALTAESENLQASCKAIYDELMAVYEQNKEDQAVYNAVGGVMAKLGALGFDPYAVQAVAGANSATISIVWHDYGNGENTRLKSLDVALHTVTSKNIPILGSQRVPSTEPVAKYTLGDGTWSYTYTGLDESKDYGHALPSGALENYDIIENGVISTFIDNPKATFHLKYNGAEPTTDVTANVIWVGDDGQTSNRPDSVTLTLNDGDSTEATATAANEWVAKFTGMKKYQSIESDALVDYSVSAEDIKDSKGNVLYFAEVNGLNVTYTYNSTDVEGEIVWVDGDNIDEVRPDAKTVSLSLQKADGTAATDVDGNNAVATFDGNSYAFKNVPAKDNDGNDIVYKVVAQNIEDTDGNVIYKASVGSDNRTVTMTHNPSKFALEGKIIWNDANNQDDKRPTEVTVTVVDGNEKSYSAAVTVGKDNTWNYKVDTLQKYGSDNQTELTYTVKVAAVTGYNEGNVTEQAVDVKNGSVADITLEHVPETTEINGTIKWLGSDGSEIPAPAGVTVTVKVKETAATVTGNDFTATVPVYEAGKVGVKVIYTAEATADGKYIQVQAGEASNNYVIKMQYNNNVAVSGDIKWNDNNNNDGKRPDKVTVSLMNGNTVVTSKELNVNNETTTTNYKLDSVPSDKAYTVKVTGLPNGYTLKPEYVSVAAGLASATADFTASYTDETIDVEGVITWKDNNNQDGVRPDSVSVKLLADGVDTQKTPTWDGNTFKFTNVAKFANGKDITYTVAVDKITGYEAEVVGYNITLTHEPDTSASHTGTITWVDDGNKANLRPESVTIILKADGIEVEDKVAEVKKDGDEWTYSFSNLQTNKTGKNGEAITYSSKVAVPDNYTAKVDGTVTTLTLETIEISAYVLGEKLDEQTINVVSNGISWTVADGDSVNVPSVWKGAYDVVADKVDGYQPKAYLVPNVSFTAWEVVKAMGLESMVADKQAMLELVSMDVKKAMETIAAGGTIAGISIEEYKGMAVSAILKAVETKVNAGATANGFVAVIFNSNDVAYVSVITVWNDNNDKEGKRLDDANEVLKFVEVAKPENNYVLDGSYESRGNVWYEKNALTISASSAGLHSVQVDREALGDDYYVNDIMIPADPSLLSQLPVDGSDVDKLTEAAKKAIAAAEAIQNGEADADQVMSWIKAVLQYQFTVRGNDYTIQILMEKLAQKLTTDSLKDIMSQVEELAKAELEKIDLSQLTSRDWVVLNLNTYVGEKTAHVEFVTIWNDYEYEENRENVTIKVTSESDSNNSVSVTMNKGDHSGYIWFKSGETMLSYVDLKDLTSTGWNIDVSKIDNYVSHRMAFPVVLSVDNGQSSDGSVLPTITASEVEALLAKVKANLKDGVSESDWTKLEQLIRDYVTMPDFSNLKVMLEKLVALVEAENHSAILGAVESVAGKVVAELEAVPTMDVRMVVVVVNSYVGDRTIKVDVLKIWDDNGDAENEAKVRPDTINFTMTDAKGTAGNAVMNKADHSGNVWYKPAAFEATYGSTTASENLGAIKVEEVLSEEMDKNYDASEVVVFPMLVPEAGDGLNLSDIEINLPASKEEVKDFINQYSGEAKELLETALTKLENSATVATLVKVAKDLVKEAQDKLTMEDITGFVKAVLAANDISTDDIVGNIENMDVKTLAGAVAVALSKVDEATLEEIYALDELKTVKNQLEAAIDAVKASEGRLEDLAALLEGFDWVTLEAIIAKLDNFDLSTTELRMVAVVVNTYNPVRDLVIKKDVVKVKKDGALIDTTPFEIEVVLTYADGTEKTYTGTVSEAVDGYFTIADIPVGTTYTVTETEKIGYLVDSAEGEITLTEDGADIEVTLINRKYNAELRKVWNGPEQGSVKVKVANEEFSFAKSVVAYIDGAENLTTADVKELNIPNNYTASYAITTENGITIITITNTYNPPIIDDDDFEWEEDDEYKVIVKKVWVGGDADNRPDVKVQLYKDGRKYRSAATLKDSKIASKNWRYVWEDVNDDDDIEWSVKEIDVPAGYKSEVTKVRDNYFIITNTWVEDKVNPGTGAF